MSQLLEALDHAHARRVWHRDIKPANLIVMMDGRVKVADFGIARIESSDLTHTGAVMGSPGYMAPEQYAAAAIDHRADIFAAGVVFYQLLTGKRPFVGSPEQIAYAICHTEVPRPSLVDPTRQLEQYDAIVAKALAKRPEDRYRNATEFRAAILEAHAAPPAPTIATGTIITEVLRPAAALDASSPPRPVPTGAPPASPSPAPGRNRSGALTAIGGIAVLAVAAGAWYALARRESPTAPPPAPVAVAPSPPAAATAPSRAQSEQETVFWESVRNSSNPAELEAYLARYPDGAFAPLARARIAALAAAAAKPAPSSAPKPAPAPPSAAPRPAAKAEANQEALFWESVRSSGNPAELKAYLDKYPEGTFAPLARARLDTLAAAAAKAAAEPKLNLPPRTGSEQATLRVPARADPARYDGRWTAQLGCEQFMERKASRTEHRVEIRAGEARVASGKSGTPGSWYLSGRITDDDRLSLVGAGISSVEAYKGEPYVASFAGRFGPSGFEGAGAFGKRRCTLAMTRAGG
jgi:hypothetical protein